jgi:hypothetical protein
MSFDLARILQSKREYRQRLAARPIAEKLAMLDALRERTLAIRPARTEPEPDALREEPSTYPAKKEHAE